MMPYINDGQYFCEALKLIAINSLIGDSERSMSFLMICIRFRDHIIRRQTIYNSTGAHIHRFSSQLTIYDYYVRNL